MRDEAKEPEPHASFLAPHPTVLIHESCCIDAPCAIGARTRIWHFSHVMRDCRIGCECTIGQNCVISPGVVIGDRCKIQNNVSVYSGVVLEDGVFLGPSMVFTNVLTPRAHIPRNTPADFAPTYVRGGATVGANATIVAGITIGRYALIGAGAVVTRDVPDFAIVYGNPARERGWACHCGATLRFAPPMRDEDTGLMERSSVEAACRGLVPSLAACCAECGSRYTMIDGAVVMDLMVMPGQ